MNHLFTNRFLSWNELEEALFGVSDALERGDAFEEFAAFYLDYYSGLYEVRNLYFPRADRNPFPEDVVRELDLGNRDLGIDGIARRTDGELLAVQVKFRFQRQSITYRELATFWSEAERASFRMVFTNAGAVTDVSERRRGHLQVTREQLESLDDTFFAALHNFATTDQPQTPPKKTPRPYQARALQDLRDGLAAQDRGKMIAACGIGKTLIALWLVEQQDARSALFVAPNLHLIRQTLLEWSTQASEPIRFLVVCSDQSVASDLDEISDASYGSDIPITTDSLIVSDFLDDPTQIRTIVLSTYQSLAVVDEATDASEFTFDIAVFDEAHKTAGLDSDTGFGIGLDDSRIPAKKRLFMTATERLFSPRIQDAALQHSRLVFSMDNQELYGPAIHRLPFSQAIDEGIISDYRIVVALLTGPEVLRVVQDYDLVVDIDDADGVSRALRTSQIFNYALLRRVVEELGPRKLVSYHSTVSTATEFARLVNEREREEEDPIHAFTVNGAMRSSARHGVINSFEASDPALLSNARCLIEGVDIPLIDGVFFASPKNSLVDIVQAVGRALRKPYGADSGKIAHVVIPIITTQPQDAIDVNASEFDRVFSVIQALRDQDDNLADLVDRMNLTVTTGGTVPRRDRPSNIQLLVPGLLSVQELEDSLMLRIADVNSNPTGTRFRSSALGRGERTSTTRRIMRTMGDYTIAVYRDSLVDPTLERMRPGNLYERADIRVNNNNVSHAERLGVIQSNGNEYSLTQLGSSYQAGEITFEDLFRNQMLLYLDGQRSSQLYPYRIILDFLRGGDRLTYWDFLYGVYAVDPDLDHDQEIDQAHQRAALAETIAIRPELANQATKEAVLTQLTDGTGVEYSFNDVWTDRTTTFNQFRYFRRHLELFGDLFGPAERELIVLPGAATLIGRYLDASKDSMSEPYGEARWLGAPQAD